MCRFRFFLFFFAVFLLKCVSFAGVPADIPFPKGHLRAGKGTAHELLPKGEAPFYTPAINRAYVHSSVMNEFELQNVQSTPSLLKRGQGEFVDNTFPKYYSPQTNSSPPPDKSVAENFMKQSSALSFIENRGQLVDTDGKTRPDILYYTNTKGLKIYFRENGLSYVFEKVDKEFLLDKNRTFSHEMNGRTGMSNLPGNDTLYRLDMNLLGANTNVQVKVQEDNKIEEYFNYYYAHCPDGITNVHAYTKITYENIYNNIDLVFYSNNQGLKYDFIVNPGGNVSDIKLQYDGAEDIKLNANGSIRITTPLGYIEEGIPRSFQPNTNDQLPACRMLESIRLENEGILSAGKPVTNYVINDNTISFDINNYDLSQTLVIDPCLVWATYYGGSGDDYSWSITSDGSGNIAITGGTTSTNFPVSAGAYQSILAGSDDAFIVKFNGNGIRLWATYYGGNGDDIGVAITADGSGNFVITGSTWSTIFPVSANAYQSANAGDDDAFVVKFTSGGSRIFGTYFGGTYRDEAFGINTDSNDNIIITGRTENSNFPVTPGAFQTTYAGIGDAFVVKLSNSGSLLWSTYYGGSNGQDDGCDIGVDLNGNITVVGYTVSTDFPVTSNAFQQNNAGAFDGFIIRFSSSGTRLYATYFGGNGSDAITQVSKNGVAFIGHTMSTNLPVTSGCYQNSLIGGNDAFVMVFGNNPVWCSYYGEVDPQYISNAICNLPNGKLAINGITRSTSFPTTPDAFQLNNAGGRDAFVAILNTGGFPVWSSYYGGTSDDLGFGITSDPSNNVYITGWTTSTNLPVSSNAFQTVNAGNTDAFIARFGGQSFANAGPDKMICFGQSTTLGLPPNGGKPPYQYLWSPPDGLSAVNILNPTASPATKTTYILIVTDSIGCNSIDSVTVNIDHVIPFADYDSTICAGSSIRIGGLAQGGTQPYAYKWSPKTDISDTTTAVTNVHPHITTTYVQTVTDAIGCSSTSSVKINVSPIPIANAGVQQIICAGSSALIGDNATGGVAPYTYSWSPIIGISDSSSAIVTASPTTTTKYIQTVVDANGCTGRDTVTVIVRPVPQIHIANKNVVLCYGSGEQIGGNASGGTPPYKFQWSPAEGLNATNIAMPMAKPDVTTRYFVTVTDTNGCSSQDTVLVTVNEVPVANAGPDVKLCIGTSVQIGESAQGGTLPYSYSWNPTTYLSASNIASPLAKPLITTTYIVNVSDKNGCESNDTVKVIVVPLPNVTVKANGLTAFCEGGSVLLTADSGFVSYNWSSGDTTHSLIARISGNYTVTVTDSNGCQATSQPIKITVNPTPKTTITGPNSVCDNAITDYSVLIENGSTYVWQVSNGTIANGQTTNAISVQWLSSGKGIVTCTQTYSSTGCSSTIRDTVNIGSKLTPKITASGPTTFCDGDSVILHAGVGYASYKWNDGMMEEWNVVKQSGNYFVTVTDANGCSGISDTIKITVAKHLSPKITASATSACDGDSIVLHAGVGYKTYRWNDGRVEEWKVVTADGIYFVTVANASGCSGSDTIAITFNHRPMPMITGAKSVCMNSKSNYSVTNTSGHTYNWNVTNGSITSGQNTNAINIQWGNAGIGIITITETITSTGCTAAKIDTINIGSNLSPTITASGTTTFCVGDSVTLHAGVGYKTYSWNDGSMEEWKIVKQGGNYFVTVTDSNGCSGTSQPITITVEKYLSPKITAIGATTFCDGDSVTLHAGVGYASYKWNDGSLEEWNVIRQSGSYIVTVTNSGGCSGSDTIDVVVNPKPTPIIQGPNSVCQNSTTNYLVTNNTGHTYNWNVIGGAIITGQNTNSINVQWGLQGVGEVEITETISSTQCYATIKFPVTIGTSLTPIITANKTIICDGDSAVLDAGAGYKTYQWNTGVTTQSMVTRTGGTYSCTVTDASGCKGTSQPITITLNPKPNPLITPNGPVSFCEGDSVILDAGIGYKIYQWNTGVTTQSMVTRVGGSYFVTVTDSNGCVGTSSPIIVTVFPLPKPIITQQGSLLTSTSSYASYQWNLNGTAIPSATQQTFTPTQNGDYTVSVIDSNGCKGISNTITIGFTITTTIGLPVLEAAPGEKISIPISLLSSQNLNQANSSDFTATLRFNKNLLAPIDSTPIGIFQNNDRLIPINGRFNILNSSLLTLNFIAMLSDTDRTPLHFDQFSWTDNRIRITTQDGEFRLKICREGGARLIDASGRLSLSQNRPNPYNASTTIDYEIIEKGHTQLFALDMLGRRVATIVDAELDPGRYEVQYDATSLSSGIYFYVLQTRTKALFKMMQVVK